MVALELLLKIIDGIFNYAYFSSCWKVVKLIPPHINRVKTVSRSQFSDPYLVNSQKGYGLPDIKSYNEDDNIIPNCQFGFGIGHSTVNRLVKLTNNVTEKFNKKYHTVTLLVDIKKAFDSIWYGCVLFKLIKHNFLLACSYFFSSQWASKFWSATRKRSGPFIISSLSIRYLNT